MPTTYSNVTINQLKCTTCQNSCKNKYNAEYEAVMACQADNAESGDPSSTDVCNNAADTLGDCTNACTSCKNN